MRGVLFIVFLCFLLLRGYDHTFTGMQYPSICSMPAQQMDNTHQHKRIHINQDHSFSKDNGINQNGDDLLCEEVEEENSNTAFSKKFTLLNKGNPGYAHTIILQHLCNGSMGCVSQSSHLSCKYIMQRTLRI